MNSNTNRLLNKFPYLRVQRKFPADDVELRTELDRSYVDIANMVNTRSIALFTMNKPTNTGQSWYFQSDNTKKQVFRQVYAFVEDGPIPHNIPNTEFLYFSRCFGFYTDGTNFYGAIFASDTGIADQITFYVTPTDIEIISTGTPPSITQGYIVLEWLTKN